MNNLTRRTAPGRAGAVKGWVTECPSLAEADLVGRGTRLSRTGLPADRNCRYGSCIRCITQTVAFAQAAVEVERWTLCYFTLRGLQLAP